MSAKEMKPRGSSPDERLAAEAKEKADRAHERKVKDMRDMLADRRFRRYIWQKILTCGVYRMSWDPSARIHFNEGVRWVGLEFVDEINEADPEIEGVMRKEAAEDAKQNG